MDYNFSTALGFALQWEGGYVNDPADPGGETKWGISKKAFPNLDIKNLTEAQRDGIYKAKYWDACKCSGLASPLDIAVFDTAVNCGVSRALRWLDASKWDYKEFIAIRNQHYINIIAKNPRLYKFKKGWLRRTGSLLALCDKISKAKVM